MKKILLLALSVLMLNVPVQANQEAKEIVYYGFDPDIVTNYISGNKRSLGYIRITAELMISDKKYLKTIEHHEPLLLDTIIGIVSKQPEDKIKSLTGREEIRLTILQQLQQVIRRETGDPIIQDLLFTKYLYQ
ncbi:flagellar basal body-associated protein FliL [Chromatiaceae bacterium AAb-1]|nr:flagellar basal body-associated protein FliL [Chromatiaceae bacterium AAb-1]